MKHSLLPYILATALALLALLISQGIWISNASKQLNTDQEGSFQTCFNQSISNLIRKNMDTEQNIPFTTIKPIDSVSLDKVMKEQKPNVIDAGDIIEGGNVALLIENALIALKIDEGRFDLLRLDTIISECIQNNNIIFSKLSLIDLKAEKLLDESEQNYNVSGNALFQKAYTAERKIDIPAHTYLIRAEYRLKQPGYLQNMGITTLVSLVASVVIISVLFYLLFILKRRNQENLNMQHSFHGAIHDLKSPLAYVYVTLSSMEFKETNPQRKAELALSSDRVLFLSDKIQRLLKSGRNLHAFTDTDKETVYLYDVVEHIQTEMRNLFNTKKIQFSTEIESDTSARVSPDLFEAVLRILLENAVKYSDDNPEINIRAQQKNGNVEITVTDNGVGISKQNLKRLFRPYYTTDGKDGTGIGLYYAHQIVNAHGGIIHAQSTPGKGSVFTVLIPK